MKKKIDYQTFIKKRLNAGYETITFRYIIGFFALLLFYFFKDTLPFPYPHFIAVTIIYLAGNTILHAASLLDRRLGNKIHNIWPFFDTAFAPLIFYCSGGFLSPFILTHLVTVIGVSIVFPERKKTAKAVYFILVVSYTGVALLQKFGVLAVHVPYAENMISNTIFFVLVVVSVNLLIGLCYFILKTMIDQLNELLENMKNTYDHVVQNMSDNFGDEGFTSLVTGLSETLNICSVFLGMVSQESEKDIIIPLTHFDNGKITDETTSLDLKGSIFEQIIEKKELYIPHHVKELFPDSTFLLSLHAEAFYGITLYSHKGEAVGVICIIHDAAFTDEYMIKSTMKIFAGHAAVEIERKKVEHEVLELQKQLKQSYKLETMGELAGDVAHDFNNVLHSIAGYCQILQKRLGVDSPLLKYPEKVITISQRASAFTNQFLSFAQKEDFLKSEVDVHAIVNETVTMMERIIIRTVAFKTNLQDTMQFIISGEASLVQNSVMNLVVNARDAMPEGGIVTIKTELKHIDESFIKGCPSAKNNKIGNYVLLSISDTGRGIDKSLQSDIFKPFFTTKEKGKGTGLGLTAVYNCVVNLNGFITVDSEAGKGSTFNIYMPLLRKTAVKNSVAREKLSEEVHPQKKRHILVADDDPNILEYTAVSLVSYGFTVKACHDGLEALTYFKENHEMVDLVVLNMSMPKMNGLQTYLKIKEIDPSIKVLISTGYELTNEEKIIFEKDVSVDLMMKPYKFKHLKKVIEEALA